MIHTYDFEFDEDGKTIEPISIGICAWDGREYFAAYSDTDLSKVNPWVRENVLPFLPPEDNAAWKPKAQIAQEICDFLGESCEQSGVREVVLYGDYPAYDHVCLMQHWGPMVERPIHLPMRTNDLQQLLDFKQRPPMPEQDGREHDALEDARGIMKKLKLLL